MGGLRGMGLWQQHGMGGLSHFPPRMEREVAVPGFLTVRVTRVTQYF